MWSEVIVTTNRYYLLGCQQSSSTCVTETLGNPHIRLFAGLLGTRQIYPEGPAAGNLDTSFLVFLSPSKVQLRLM
jgi:hypothetical protein